MLRFSNLHHNETMPAMALFETNSIGMQAREKEDYVVGPKSLSAYFLRMGCFIALEESKRGGSTSKRN